MHLRIALSGSSVVGGTCVGAMRARACLSSSRWAFCLARLSAEYFLCFSVQTWHLPLPGRAGLGQYLHWPVWRSVSRSCRRRCRLYSFRSGVWFLAWSYSLRCWGSEAGFLRLGSFGVCRFLVSFVSEGCFMCLLALLRSGSWNVSVRNCVFACFTGIDPRIRGRRLPAPWFPRRRGDRPASLLFGWGMGQVSPQARG